MRKTLLICISFFLMVTAIFRKVYKDTNRFKVNNVEFVTNKIPVGSNFTILQLTDIHNKVFGENNEELIATIKSRDADIIVITGDLIDRLTEEFDHAFHLIEKLVAINEKVYYVSGNHECDHPHKELFFAGLKERKVTILDNTNELVNINGVTFQLVGVANASTGHHQLSRALANIKNDYYTVLLSHAPNIIDEYHDASVDLTLCGHTHGGQIRLPLVGAIVGPDNTFFPKLDKGTFELDPNQYLYIDSGLGTTARPIRFMNQSQFSFITVKHEREKG
ncbi:metallophosphoesterase [Aquibacillus koreensis]|uniref:Metallophosphoesterase n=1 Tax=Aquibacillus koreensis TaxID=279446 RepID=A0A9X3WHS3_9BACI|nr:metallophosphoesterase [Aquibacillus koreensis]MCT2535713.1 metallophosphoesterase [Aquibacillus koreensis]MDC3420002.1 metallophosphoesterase [Aquibacillus koreensis]